MFNLAILSLIVTELLYLGLGVPYKGHRRHHQRARKGGFIPSSNCGALQNATFCEEDANYPPQSLLNRIARRLGKDEKTALLAASVDYEMYNSDRRNQDYGGDYVDKQLGRGTRVCAAIKKHIAPRSGTTLYGNRR